MEGCGHCITTKPEWDKLEEDNELNSSSNNKILIARINANLFDKIHNRAAGEEPTGFPTFKYIKHKKIEDYDSDRTKDAFIKWIKEKLNKDMKGGSRRKRKTKTQKKRKTMTRKLQKGKNPNKKTRKTIRKNK
jgi:thiol-disulfide isomerase/thioredoxin